MKLFAKKATPKKAAAFTAINKSELRQVKGGTKREPQREDAEID